MIAKIQLATQLGYMAGDVVIHDEELDHHHVEVYAHSVQDAVEWVLKGYPVTINEIGKSVEFYGEWVQADSIAALFDPRYEGRNFQREYGTIVPVNTVYENLS